MRNFKKFLYKNKWHIYSFFFKKRVLNLKRTKWKQIRSRIYYIMRHYKRYKQKFIYLKYRTFLKNIKKCIKIIKNSSFLIKKNYIIFLKKLKVFFFSRKYKKLKFKLKNKLTYFFKRPYYQRYNFFSRCFNLFFFNFKFIKLSHKFHLRSRFFFKNRLLMKSSILHYFFGSIPVKKFKNIQFSKTFKNDLILFFIKPEYRLDILLWRLHFFISPYLARFAFQQNLIQINKANSLNIFYNKFYFKNSLNYGDTLSLNSKINYSFQKNLLAFAPSLFLPTLFEIDYYTNNIVILKTLNNLNFIDINSILKEPLSMYKFKNFINK
jgi:hypothetical protein